MVENIGARIAAAALDLIGVPFRLHGRDRATGVDCVGLVWLALQAAGLRTDSPRGYSIRGGITARQLGWAGAAGLHTVPDIPIPGPIPGDVLLVRPAPTQAHLMIVTEQGLVHADAGLRRVVLRPGTDWPVLQHFRYRNGEHSWPRSF